MGEATEILIEIKGSAKEFVEALEALEHKAGSLESQLKFTAASSAIAFAALTAEIGFAVHAYGKQEKATNQLVQALQNQGIYSKEMVHTYREQAEAIEAKTGIDAEQIVQGQAVIQTLIGQTEISKELTQAAVDLSVRTGSVSSAFEVLGLGINGRTRGLQQLGIVVDAHLSKEERMAKILQIVAQQHAGQAEAASSGVAGIVKLEAAFENIQKQIGEHFAPAVVAVEHGITNLLNSIAKNKPLVEFISYLLAAGVAAAAVVSVISGIALAVTTAIPLLGLFGVALSAALGPVGLVAIAVGALGAAVGVYALKSDEAGEKTKALETKIRNMHDAVARYQSLVDHPTGHSFVDDKALSNLDEAKRKLADFEVQLKALQPKSSVDEEGQDKGKKERAAKAAADKADRESRELAALRAQDELVRAETENASKDLIDIKKQEADLLVKIADEKHKSERGALQAKLAELRELEDEQLLIDIDKRSAFDDEILAHDAEFQALSLSERKEFLLRNQAALQASLDTERTMRIKAAKEVADVEIASNNQFLKDQQKFGTAFANINKVMHSEIYKGSKKAFGELAELQNSSNETLKAIGKASAVANIIIKTAESAMNIYEGFSIIPFIGPVLGVAGAAAAIAFGAEQIGNVLGAADGGLVTGGIPGMDSVRAMLMPGELIVPEKNFDEVVDTVAAQRASGSGPAAQSQGGQTGLAHIQLSLKDDLMDLIEFKMLERERLNISLRRA